MRSSYKLEGGKDLGFYLSMTGWLKKNISMRDHGNWVLRRSDGHDEFTELLFAFMQYQQCGYDVLNKIDGILMENGDGWVSWLISYRYFDVEFRREVLYQEAFYEIEEDCHAIMLQLAIFGAQP